MKTIIFDRTKKSSDWLHSVAAKNPMNKIIKKSDDEMDKDELERGIEVEYEHGTGKMSEAASLDTNVTDDDPVKTAKIAIAHLRELPDYYERLDEMEEEGKEDLYGGQMKKSIIVNEINSFLTKAERNKRDEVKERLLGDIERFIQHYSKAIDKKSIDSINYFLKEYEKLTLLEQYDNVNRINNLYSTAEEINVSKGLNINLDKNDMINSISSVAHSLYMQKDNNGHCQYPILDELVQISKSYQKEYKNPGIIVLQDPAKLVSQNFGVEVLQKSALERSSKFWGLFEKAIKEGIESLSNFEIIALREFLYAKS